MRIFECECWALTLFFASIALVAVTVVPETPLFVLLECVISKE
jgi:hypothetical protein